MLVFLLIDRAEKNCAWTIVFSTMFFNFALLCGPAQQQLTRTEAGSLRANIPGTKYKYVPCSGPVLRGRHVVTIRPCHHESCIVCLPSPYKTCLVYAWCVKSSLLQLLGRPSRTFSRRPVMLFQAPTAAVSYVKHVDMPPWMSTRRSKVYGPMSLPSTLFPGTATASATTMVYDLYLLVYRLVVLYTG